VLLAVLFMAYYLNRNWMELQKHKWDFDPALFLFSCVLLWIAMGSATFMNKLIFKTIAGAHFSFWHMFKIFNLTNIGRYLPGKLWNVLGLFYLTKEYGISKRDTMLAVIISEIGYKGSAIIIGILYFMFAPLYKNLLPVMIAVLILFLIVIHPRILGYLINILLKLIKKQPVEITFNYLVQAKYILLYFIVWFLHSLAFYVFVNSFTSTETIGIFHFLTIMPLCWIVGYIIIFAPGGIGVREGMLVLILGQYIPSELAAVIAISQRIWFILIEGINTLIAVTITSKNPTTKLEITKENDSL